MDLKSLFTLFFFFCVDVLKGQTTVNVPIYGDAVLPVQLKTTLDQSSVEVDWTFHGTHVITFRSGKSVQGENYRNRSFLFEDKIAKGNISLKLMNVTEKDAGTYICSADGENVKEPEITVSLVLLIKVPASASGTTILPVHLRTRMDKLTITVEWKFNETLVGSFSNGKSKIKDRYKGKALFFEDKITEGNISLKLSDITEDDHGNYTCIFHDKKTNVRQMIVFLVKKHDEETDERKDETNPTKKPDQRTNQENGFGAGFGAGFAVCFLVVVVVGGVVWFIKRRNRPDARAQQQPIYALDQRPEEPVNDDNEEAPQGPGYILVQREEPVNNDNEEAPLRHRCILVQREEPVNDGAGGERRDEIPIDQLRNAD